MACKTEDVTLSSLLKLEYVSKGTIGAIILPSTVQCTAVEQTMLFCFGLKQFKSLEGQMTGLLLIHYGPDIQ